MSVRFRFGWIDAGPSPDILAQSTMAALSVEAGGTTVTSVLDRGNRIYSNEVVVPLFSVAEWLVTNWWHIWYEVGDASEQRPAFESRHNLAFAADGFVLPSLNMIPTSVSIPSMCRILLRMRSLRSGNAQIHPSEKTPWRSLAKTH